MNIRKSVYAVLDPTLYQSTYQIPRPLTRFQIARFWQAECSAGFHSPNAVRPPHSILLLLLLPCTPLASHSLKFVVTSIRDDLGESLCTSLVCPCSWWSSFPCHRVGSDRYLKGSVMDLGIWIGAGAWWVICLFSSLFVAKECMGDVRFGRAAGLAEVTLVISMGSGFELSLLFFLIRAVFSATV